MMKRETGAAPRTRALIAGGVALFVLAGCGGGGGGGGGNTGINPPPPVNRAPSRIALTNHTVADSQTTSGGYPVGTLYGDDPDGDTVTLSLVGGADAASFALAGNELLLDDGVLNAAAKGSYTVTVRAEDPDGAALEADLTILVNESAPIVVGYYDLLLGTGRAEQATPITFIGETAMDVGDIGTADLSGFDMLFVQNPSSGSITGPYAQQANLDKVAAFVEAGGVLIFHDRHVATTANFLPGMPGDFVQDIGSTRTEFELIADQSFVALGPGGTIDDTNLESANSLSFGYVEADSTPRGSVGYLSRNATDHWITYSYPAGAGHVIYSSIPLDFYLIAGNPEIMRSTYAPNVLAQGRMLRNKGIDTDGDGLSDAEEDLVGSSTASADSDGDGLTDLYEVRHGLNPASAGDVGLDPDGDGLSNTGEQTAGSHPRVADTDGDGLSDGVEIATHGTDPTRTDSDDDGLADSAEINVLGTDPTLADTDGGGTDDGREWAFDLTDPLDPTDDLNQVDLPVSYTDVNGYLWDIQRDGNINNGSNDAYDGGMRLLLDGASFQPFDTASLMDGQRELKIGEQAHNGLSVSRRVFVPEGEAFVRYLEVLVNPTGTDLFVQVQIDTNLGSDGNTVIVSTSDGDATIEASDTWVVTDDTSNGGGDPSLAHVFAGAGGSVQPVVTAPLGRIVYTYGVTVPANGRAIVMHFDSQNADRAAASASAASLVGLGGGALDGITTEERADIVNFAL